MEPDLAQGRMAPSSSERFLSGTTSMGSISDLVPSPVQSGQAPWGELKLKVLGSISSMLVPQTGQAKCSLNSDSSPSTIEIRTIPPASFNAVSTESASLPACSLSPDTNRSTTTSIVWRLYFSKLNSSARSRISPSTRTRT